MEDLMKEILEELREIKEINKNELKILFFANSKMSAKELNLNLKELF